MAETLEQDRKYGLTKPVLTVIVEAVGEADEKVVYNLLIGGQLKDESGSHYARLGGDATVFVLSGKDVELLQKGLVFTKED